MKKLLASLGILVVAMSTVAMAYDHQMWNMNGEWDMDYTYGSSHYYHTMSVATFDPVTGDFAGTGEYCTGTPKWTVAGNLNMDTDAVGFKIKYDGSTYYVDSVGTMSSEGLVMGGSWKNDYQSGTFTAKTACDNIMGQTVYYTPAHYYSRDTTEPVPIKDYEDDFGYNYVAHYFEGYYVNVYLGGYGYPYYDGDDANYLDKLDAEGYTSEEIHDVSKVPGWGQRHNWLRMDWNDAWLSNKDCGIDGAVGAGEPDGSIDRHYGFSSYIDSGAWLTNELSGIGKDLNENECKAQFYSEFMAVPGAEPCEEDSTMWCLDGEVLGPTIWGAFAVVVDEQTNNCGKLNRVSNEIIPFQFANPANHWGTALIVDDNFAENTITGQVRYLKENPTLETNWHIEGLKPSTEYQLKLHSKDPEIDVAVCDSPNTGTVWECGDWGTETFLVMETVFSDEKGVIEAHVNEDRLSAGEYKDMQFIVTQKETPWASAWTWENTYDTDGEENTNDWGSDISSFTIVE